MKQAYVIAGVVVIAFIIGIVALQDKSIAGVQTFSSEEELSTFMQKSVRTGDMYYGGSGISALDAVAESGDSDNKGVAAPTSAGSAEGSIPRYGTTNVQVENVDEPDMIKNDGRYLYVVSGNYVSIIDAYPTNSASLLAKMQINGSVQNILIEGDRLIIFGQENYYSGYCPQCDFAVEPKIAIDYIAPPSYGSQHSFIATYDISNKAEPNQEQYIRFEGWMHDARMINSRVYAVTQQPLLMLDNDVALPSIEYGGSVERIAVQDIMYFGVPDVSYQLTTIITFDTQDASSVDRASFLTGSTQTLYVSENNLYLASNKYIPYESYQKEFVTQVYLDNVDSETREILEEILARDPFTVRDNQELQDTFTEFYNKLSQEERETITEHISTSQREFNAWVAKETQKTVIDKIQLQGSRIEYGGKAEVPGTIINQFSMDEYDDHFRIATTTGDSWSQSSLNHLYILDNEMNVVGSLENLAQTERIYSVRFIGERAYMVTFRQIDPLFVIDLSDVTAPRVLGELKIPGYSTYLHPYDADHIIGIGQDTAGDVQEGGIRAAIPAGIKMALFDVADVTQPKELSKITIGGQGSYSQALYDHKAFLFDKETGVLAIPVTEYKTVMNTQYNYPEQREAFNGLHVYHLDLNGFTLKGKITHLNSSEIKEINDKGYSNYAYEAQISRSTFIGEVLYTLSTRSLEAHSLSTFNEEFSISLPHDSYSYPTPYAVRGEPGAGVMMDATEPAPASDKI